ncbi:hypothetical protein, partial [Ralstonia pickettii]|uniref:hypothetical protein n=1 Tax=Ralstonia pickettii TaxID=329 RepID=UPI001F3A93A3
TGLAFLMASAMVRPQLANQQTKQLCTNPRDFSALLLRSAPLIPCDALHFCASCPRLPVA